VDRRAIRYYFSGQKGVSLELPATLIGGLEPSPDLPERAKRFVRALAAGGAFATLDYVIYEKMRLWRVPNTRHGESGLYKIPLTWTELATLDIAEIRERARGRRDIDQWPDHEWLPVPELVELWRASAEPAAGDAAHERLDTAAALAGVPEGERDSTLWRLACKLRRTDVPRDWAERLVVEAAENCDPPFSVDVAREKVARAYRQYEPASAEAPHDPSDSRFAGLPHTENRANREDREPPRFALTPLSALLAEPAEDVAYVVDGMLPVGGVSLCGAKPKVGKSTTARNCALRVGRGEPFLDRATLKGPVVYLALEEKRGEVQKHFARMGATDEPIYVHTGSAPEEALEALRAAIAEHKPVLAIIDPVLKLVRLRDANDYAEVSRAFEPLIDLARSSGCHLMCVHHLGKGERTGGDAVLGSTALFGAVDTLLLMKRREATRTLETIQRYGDDMPETVISMDPETGLIAGGETVAEAQMREVGKQVEEAIGDGALTEPEIKERVGGNQTVVAKAIRARLESGHLVRSGGGKRGDPYVYSLAGVADNSRFAQLLHTENRANREAPAPVATEAVPAEVSRERVFRALRRGETATVDDIRERTGLAKTAILEGLRSLEVAEQVERRGTGGTGLWALVGQEAA
jgi:hypothetical protein